MGTIGCGDKSDDTGSAGSAPDIAVDISEVAFGEVSAGDASERILISNDGTADLNISSAYLTDLAENLSAFPLSEAPPTGTITVTVGGSEESRGWSYSEESNTVIFDSPPKTWAEIEVSYERVGTCE